MKKDQKTLKEVAKHCTCFSPCKCNDCRCSNTTTNSTKEEEISCSNCEHFDSSKMCTLDLYQEIISNHHL